MPQLASDAERKARNEATFREANARLEQGAHELVGADDGQLVPFICECPRPECTQVVLVSLAEYREVQERALAVAAPGHEDLEVDRVVGKNDRFVFTEKIGRAGDVWRAETEAQ